MSDEKITAIAERLLEKSEKGEVAWSDTADENTFAVDFPDYSITVGEYVPHAFEINIHRTYAFVILMVGFLSCWMR